jgi:hypothetical protein
VSRTPVLKRKWYFTGHTAFFVWESWSGEDGDEEKRKEEEEENPWRDPFFYGEREEEEEEGWEE